MKSIQTSYCNFFYVLEHNCYQYEYLSTHVQSVKLNVKRNIEFVVDMGNIGIYELYILFLVWNLKRSVAKLIRMVVSKEK